MAWVFNPFTGTFDFTNTGGGGGTPGGSSGQIQYNASGSFGGMAGTSWDNTNRALTLTGATVSTSQPVLNLSQTWSAGAVTFKGAVINITDTASSLLSGALELQYEGSPYFRFGKGFANSSSIWLPYGALTPSTSNFTFAQSSSGLDINTPSSTRINIGVATGWGVTYQTDELRFANTTGVLGWSASGSNAASDLKLTRGGTATLQLGAADAASAVAQTLQVQSSTGAGTTGPNFTIKGSAGTTAGGSIIFQTAATTSFANALVIDSTGATAINNATVVGNTKLTVSGTSGLPSTTFKGVASFYADNNLTLSIGGQQNSTYLQALDRRSGSAGQYGIFLNPQGGNVGVGYFGGGSGVWQPGATLTIVSTGSFGWDSGSGASGTADVTLFRDTNDTLALRRTTIAGPTTYPQTFRVYNNFDGTVGGNNEFGVITWSSNVLTIGAQVSGTGTVRSVKIVGGNNNNQSITLSNSNSIDLFAGGSTWMTVSPAGWINPVWTGGTPWTIGSQGDEAGNPNRVGSSIRIQPKGGSGNGAAAFIQLYTGLATTAGTTGHTSELCVQTFLPATGTPGLQFGGTTSLFPALKRSGTTIQVRLADDSAFTNIQGKLTTDTAYTATPQTCTGYITIYDSTGTAYKVMVST